jgi:hypothetical protein
MLDVYLVWPKSSVNSCTTEQGISDHRGVLRKMVSSGMLRRVAFVRTDVSEELSASIIRVTRIGELGT